MNMLADGRPLPDTKPGFTSDRSCNGSRGDGTMAWFFTRPAAPRTTAPKTIKPIARRLQPTCEELEKRVVFSANVWLAQQLQPLDGVSGYAQSFQAYHAALGQLLPESGMTGGVAT